MSARRSSELPVTWCQRRLLSPIDLRTFAMRSFLSRERLLAGRWTRRNDRTARTAAGVGLSEAESRSAGTVRRAPRACSASARGPDHGLENWPDRSITVFPVGLCASTLDVATARWPAGDGSTLQRLKPPADRSPDPSCDACRSLPRRPAACGRPPNRPDRRGECRLLKRRPPRHPGPGSVCSDDTDP
jgi:hypothetical protein